MIRLLPVPEDPTTMRQKDTPFLVALRLDAIVVGMMMTL